MAGNSSAQNIDTTTPKHLAVSFDDKLAVSINHWGDVHPGLDRPMEFLSNTASIPFVAIPAGIYFSGIANHDREQAISGMAIGVGEGVSGVMTQVIKVIFQRDRPYHVLDDMRTPDNGAGGYAFPSGHATGVWSMAAGLSLQYPKWYVIAPAAIYATAVSLSRSYLGVHYVSDLIGGALVGIGCSYLVYRYENQIAGLFPAMFPNETNSATNAARVSPNLTPHSYGMSFSFTMLPAPRPPR